MGQKQLAEFQEAGYNTTDPVSYRKCDLPTTLDKCLSPDKLPCQRPVPALTDEVFLKAVTKPKAWFH